MNGVKGTTKSQPMGPDRVEDRKESGGALWILKYKYNPLGGLCGEGG